ncbi:MAG: hypothetical protein IKE23_08845 [Exiguobacterium sp.]|nr:hypothetical protein [Exiguobacterium sp.]
MKHKNEAPFTIMTTDYHHCFLCGSPEHIEWHHIYPSGLRKKSTEYGMVVPLCRSCHQGPHGVHSNVEKLNKLKALGQEMFERKYPTESFLRVFHRNWR